ncbi:MAG TPA: hypothetical protein VN927_03620 [Gemmatimonadaceae bacterium]|nr:hypothetical protein [Gemmatimonadaceae bacterium]
MLVATRRLFSWNFQFVDDGTVVGEMVRSLWRETAELELADGSYGFYRDQVIGGDYVLERNGQILARATKLSWWRSNLDVELLKRSVKLRRPSIFMRRFAVFEGGTRVGFINPLRLTGSARIELPSDWTLLDRIFLFWLCSLMWRRQPNWMIQIT